MDLLVYCTAELISRFMPDLQPDRQTEKMAEVSSLLPTKGLVNGDITHATHNHTHTRAVCPAFHFTCLHV